jgi:hypothetical protein
MAKRMSKVQRLCNHRIVPTFCNSRSFSLRFRLLRSLSASVPHRGSRPLHSSILWTGFGVLVQEVVQRGLECKLLVPPFVHFSFVGFWSRLDHPRSPVLMRGGLTRPGGGLTVSGGGLTGSEGARRCVTCGVPLWRSDCLLLVSGGQLSLSVIVSRS